MDTRRELTAIESALAADVARLTEENERLMAVCEDVMVAAVILVNRIDAGIPIDTYARDQAQAACNKARAALKVTI